MRQVIKYADMGYKKFFFTDDNFAQNPAEAIALCKGIGDYKRKFRKKIDMIVQVRSEAAENDELIEAMRWAGVLHWPLVTKVRSTKNCGLCAKA